MMRNTSAEIAWERAGELLARLSVEEKAQQVSSVLPLGIVDGDCQVTPPFRSLLQDGIGHVAALGMFGFKSPSVLARAANSIQRFLVDETAHGIPAIIHNEALNGVVAPDFTVFPTAIALAATWDPSATFTMARLIAQQLRAVGLHQALSPVLDLGRDARWGRVHETYGEDAYLVSEFGVAFTRGLQSDDLSTGVIATAKHFLGYAQSQAGQNMAAVQLGGRETYEDLARPFEAAIHLAGLASVMNSYSSIDGIPAGASRELLTDFLRGRLGFDGTVVSDYSTVQMLHNRLAVAADAEAAGILALSAGLDVELAGQFGYGRVLATAVRDGKVSEELLDESARRVLRDKFALGLFDHPYVPEDPIVIDELAHRGEGLSGDLARKSVTLLKNDHDVLPLAPGTKKIAIIGPHADDVTLSFPTYTYPAVDQLLRDMAGGTSSMAGVDLGTGVPAESTATLIAEFTPLFTEDSEHYIRRTYPASTLTEAVRSCAPDADVVAVPAVGWRPEDPEDVEAAVQAARDADIAVLAVGGKARWFTKGVTEGEGCDSADIELPENQQRLIRAVAATGTPIIAVLSMGRPYALTPVIEDLQAVITAYYGGPHGPQAVAEALFGVTNPAGRLPVTIPRHSGQVPIYAAHHTGSGYHRSDADMHSGYLDMPALPLFPFGHGLSYTHFTYGALTTTRDAVQTDEEIIASVTVTNTGPRRGEEVVQLYGAKSAHGVTRPVRELIAFRRIELEPGACATITFTVPLTQLGHVDRAGDFVVAAGPLRLLVGASSEDIRCEQVVDVQGETQQLRGKRTFLASSTVLTTQATVPPSTA